MRSESISIIIPSFNGKELLKANLPSVLTAARRGDELIIVDDASSDGSLRWLKRRFTLILDSESIDNQIWVGSFTRGPKRIEVKVLVNLSNQRFAQSVNRAFVLARFAKVFLLNNDVSPAKSCINQLIKTFSENDIFAVGCLESEDEADLSQRSGKNKLWFERGLFHHQRANNFAFGVTAWASGGSSMFDRQKWLELGGFDLKFYPAYWEDIDISARAREKGYKVLFQPLAEVFHRHESTNAAVFSQEDVQLNSWKHADYFSWKHADFWQKIAYILWRPYWIWVRRRLSGQSSLKPLQ